MKYLQKIKFLFLTLTSIFFIFLAIGSEEETQANQVKEAKEQTASLNIPEEQANFESSRKLYYEKYLAGQNEIKKSAVFNNANADAATFRKNNKGLIQNFVGKITDIATDQGGDYVSIVIQSSSQGITVSYKTWNNSFSDIGDNTMPAKGSKIYNQVAEFAEGDYVYFSAKTIKDSQRGMKEGSLTELGSLKRPEFIVKFTDIIKAE